MIERRDAKQAIYQKIDAVRKPGSIVSSNTSTIPCADLMEGMPASFAADFFITHFFNPPRYMRLLEIVEGATTKPEAVASVREFADRKLGKGVVDCKDTPGFIANRFGTLWIVAAVEEALKGKVTKIEYAMSEKSSQGDQALPFTYVTFEIKKTPHEHRARSD